MRTPYKGGCEYPCEFHYEIKDYQGTLYCHNGNEEQVVKMMTLYLEPPPVEHIEETTSEGATT